MQAAYNPGRVRYVPGRPGPHRTRPVRQEPQQRRTRGQGGGLQCRRGVVECNTGTQHDEVLYVVLSGLNRVINKEVTRLSTS